MRVLTKMQIWQCAFQTKFMTESIFVASSCNGSKSQRKAQERVCISVFKVCPQFHILALKWKWMKEREHVRMRYPLWCLIFCLNPFFWLTSFFPSLNWLWEKFMCTLCHKTNQLPPKLSPAVASNNISRGQIGKTGLITMYCVTHTYTYIQKIEALSWIVALFGPDELYGTYRVWWYYFRISNHLKCMRKRGTLLLCESSMDEVFCAYFIEFVVTVAKGILFCLLIGPG